MIFLYGEYFSTFMVNNSFTIKNKEGAVINTADISYDWKEIVSILGGAIILTVIIFVLIQS